MRRVHYDVPHTLKKFLDYMLTVHTPCESVRDLWVFEGAYLAGRIIHPEEFPLEQAMGAWHTAYDEWQKVRKEVAA